MKGKINSYFAVLIIVVAGAGAAMIIIHAATTNTLSATVSGTEASYAPLKQSILRQ